MVEQYRAGSSSVDVGKRFGCSDRTVMRIVRSRLSAAELETCKARSYKKQARSGPAAADTVAGDEPMDNLNGANNLPWADADDFVESGGAVDDMAVEEGATALTATGRHRSAKATHRSAEGARGAANLDVNTLPSPLYLLVERSVELQPQTLGSLHHLAPLDKEEQQRQGLILFSNVRQARRQCRRNQRIVKDGCAIQPQIKAEALRRSFQVLSPQTEAEEHQDAHTPAGAQQEKTTDHGNHYGPVPCSSPRRCCTSRA